MANKLEVDCRNYATFLHSKKGKASAVIFVVGSFKLNKLNGEKNRVVITIKGLAPEIYGIWEEGAQ